MQYSHYLTKMTLKKSVKNLNFKEVYCKDSVPKEDIFQFRLHNSKSSFFDLQVRKFDNYSKFDPY